MKQTYREILKHSSKYDEITKGHIKIKARYIVHKHRDSHELATLAQMYDLLKKLEKRCEQNC